MTMDDDIRDPGAADRPLSRKDLREPRPVTGAQRAIGATLGRPRPRGRAAVVLAVVVVAAVVLIPLGIFKMVGRPAPAGSAVVARATGTVAADAPVDQALDVAGRIGSVPVVSLHGVLAVPSSLVTDVVVAGQGHVLSQGDGVVLSVATFSGVDGSMTTGTASGRRVFRGTVSAQELGEDLASALVGVAEGSRLVMREAVTDGSGASSTQITVVDVLLTRAHGEDVSGAVDASTVPDVSVADDGQVTVSTAGKPVPTAGMTAILVNGDGEQVRSGDSVIARYAVFGWDDAAERSSSYAWTTPAGIINLSSTITGLAQRLVDVPVGSRVVVSLPADQARGDGAIVVVVDVVAAVSEADVAGGSAGATAAPSSQAPAVKVSPSAQATASGS